MRQSIVQHLTNPVVVTRSFLLLLFLLGLEIVPWARSNFQFPLAFPILDIGISDSQSAILTLLLLNVVGTILALQGRWFATGAVLAALTSFLLVVTISQGRLQFHFLPSLTLLAFVQSDSRKLSPDRPLVCLLASIYGFACFHKLLHFPQVLEQAPGLIAMGKGVLAGVCRPAGCVLSDFVLWSVIPVEALLCMSMTFRRWMKMRIVLASVFHFLVAVLVPEVRIVSAMMLGLHLHLLCLQQPKVTAQFGKFLRARWLVLSEALLIMGWMIAETPLQRALLLAVITQLPFWFLYWPFLRQPSVVLERSASWDGWQRAYLLFLLVFGFSPLLMVNPYSLPSLGWTMLSGGHMRQPQYQMLTPRHSCFVVKASIVFALRPTAQGYVYTGYREADLLRLREIFLKSEACAGVPQSTILNLAVVPVSVD